MTVKDRSSMYNTLEYWTKELAPKYFDMGSINISRIGMFGYLNEIFADATSDIINENLVLFNEIFFKKCQIPESILTYAAQYRIEDINAKPAVMEFTLGIREDTLLENSVTDANGNSYFIIDSDSEIILEDDFKYMLDYNVKISIKKINKRHIYSAQYVMNKTNDLSDIKNPYLKVTTQKMDGLTYLYIIVKARQIDKITVEQTVFNDDLLSFVTKDFKYTGTLADFDVYYKGPNDKDFIQIKKLIIDSPPVDEKFCYYQYKDDNTINISFSTLQKHFKPEFNSTIRMEIYTTRACDGNFDYTGDNVRINLKSETIDYKKVIMLAASLSKSYGAEDKFSYTELKDMVSYYASTSNNIGTTIDLDRYFTKLNSQSKLTFVKKRDDILDRLFTGYMLMKDSNDTIIPTNTVNLELGKNQFDTSDENLKRYIIKAGAKFVYKDEDSFELKRVDEFTEDHKFRYSNPHTIVVNKNPLSISYYMNSMNKKFNTDFSYMNDLSFFQFITNSITIKRDAINGDDAYNIEFTTIPNISDVEFGFANMSPEGKFQSSNDRLKVFGLLHDEQNNNDKYIEFKMVDYTPDTKEMKFSCRLTTDDYISATNKLRITNTIKKAGEILPDILIEATEMKMELLLMYKDDDTNINHKYEEIIPESKGRTLTNSYSLIEDINLINDMTDIMRSTIKFKLLKQNDYSQYSYYIRNMPFTNYDYIKSRKCSEEYVRNLFTNADTIRAALKLITNNFSIDLKMYNTYGKSKYFYICGDKNRLLDNVNLSIDLTIKLNPANLLNTTLQYDIKEFIKDYVESVNNDNNLYISNLIRELENSFRDIIYIEFNRINKYDNSVQSIEKNFPTHIMSRRNDMIEFVPEFVNIAKDYYEDDIVDYRINIKFI